MNSSHDNFTLSVILLSFESEKKIINVFNRVDKILTQSNIPFEFIIIDDGSNDNSFEVANELEAKYANVHSYRLSRNYTSHYAAFAGLSVSNGACATVIPDDEQQPLEQLVEMYHLWQIGSKVIIPYRNDRSDNFFDTFFAKLFYRVVNLGAEVKMPSNGADTWFIDREIIDILDNRISPRRTTTITEILRLGFDPVYISYTRTKSNDKSRWTFRKKLRLASDWFYSSSSILISFISTLGVLVFLSSFALAGLYIYAKCFGSDHFWNLAESPGWVSIVCLLLLSLGLIMLSLGIVAQYIWRIFEEVKGRPGFIIQKKEK